MQLRSRLVLAALVAALTLLGTVGASASRLSLSDTDVRMSWESFSFSYEEEGPYLSCPVVIEGAFHQQAFEKTFWALWGFVTEAVVGPEPSEECSESLSVLIEDEAPWHILYRGFGGTLPLISSIELALVGASFRIVLSPSLDCLVRSSSTEWLELTGTVIEGGAITELTIAEGFVWDLNDSPGTGSIACDLLGVDGRFEGTASVEDADEAALRVALA